MHLTQVSFLSEALCGEPVGLEGEPYLAVICEGCDRLAREAGGDSDGWVTTIADVRLELRAAASEPNQSDRWVRGRRARGASGEITLAHPVVMSLGG